MKKIKCLSALFALSTVTAMIPAIASCSTANSDKNSSNNSATLNKSGICKVTFLSTDKDVKFEGNTVAEIKSGRKFGSIDKPTATKSGYKFNYWTYSDNGAEIKDTAVINSSTTVTPVFSQEQATVTINKMDGSKTITEKVNVGNSITFPAVTRSGYEFKNWVDQDGKTYEAEATVTIQKDMSFSVLWEGEQKITVTLSSGKGTFSDGSTLISKSLSVNSTIKMALGTLTVIPEDESEDYFSQWTSGSTTYDESSSLINDIILTAKFEPRYAPTLASYPSAVGIKFAETGSMWITNNDSNAPNLLYSRDAGQTWTKVGGSSSSTTFYAGENVYLKGNNSSGFSSSSSKYSVINIGGKVNLNGSIMGLLDNGAGTLDTIPCTYCFYKTFSELSSIKYIDTNFLPATTLTDYCYNSLFLNCTSLVNHPNLPAATLTTSCYASLFKGCSSLKEINITNPSSSLAATCYASMYYGCSSLTSIPSNLLPATTLTSSCYNGMFRNCTSLTSIPENLLQATSLEASCYQYMFSGCKKLAAIPENLLPASTMVSQCYYHMFSSTGITAIPEKLLDNVTTLAKGCYEYMFSNCSKLVTIPQDLLKVTTVYEDCYCGMFLGCCSLETVPSNFLPAETTVSSCYRYMFKACRKLKTLPENFMLATEIGFFSCADMFVDCVSLDNLPSTVMPNVTKVGSDGCLYMFKGCIGLTSLPSSFLPATNVGSTCYDEMFRDCSGLQTIPEDLLPATTVSSTCYWGMFYNCTNLTTVPKLPASTLASSCYGSMFYGCSKLKISKTDTTGTLFFTCPSTIPSGAVSNMFDNTGGTFQSDPTANTSYYCYQ